VSFSCRIAFKSLTTETSLHLHAAAKSNVDLPNELGWWVGVGKWHMQEMLLVPLSSTQVTSKRPASSPAPQTASSVSGPTGHAAASPVEVV
jgi:hypothetical protein